MQRLPFGKLITVALFLFSFLILSSDDVVAFFRSLIDGGPLGALAYLAVTILAVVAAPVSVLPLVPLAASVLGAPLTALLSVIGYTAGAVIAFILAQRVGRPVLRYFVALDSIDRWQKRIPPDSAFWSVVLLRIVTPVDLLSYALGLLTAMPLRTYALATAIGVTPFAVIFSYGGAALSRGSVFSLLGISIVGLLLYIYVWKRMRRLTRQSREAPQEDGGAGDSGEDGSTRVG